MSINIAKFNKLNELVSLEFRRKHTIVLNPDKKEDIHEEDIIYDKANWKITDELKKYVDELSQNNDLSIEDKILYIYEKICKDYVYDDNLISYIKKIDEDVFSIPDWYGRDVDQEWEKNRENHNRRICFELSRYLAKALDELLKENKDYDVCILWNKNLTHYFVGLTSNEYTLALDVDDFFNIKDLTRVKADLTIEGIQILEDNKNKFKNALEKFNDGKNEYAIKKVEDKINTNNVKSKEKFQNKDQAKTEDDEVKFLAKAMQILSEEYKLDSQGMYEYMKEIVDIRIGSEGREKIWKKIEGNTNESTRYIRCLILDINNKKYLVDVENKEIREFDEKELEEKRTKFVPYKELSRGGFDYYDGT
jgi:hypothetical protein